MKKLLLVLAVLCLTGTANAQWATQANISIGGGGGGGGGGITGAGAANQITYWTGAATVAGNAFLTTDPATGDLDRIKNVPYDWPAANAAGVLTNDGAGNLTWAAGGGFANTALSNLAAVAVNASLIAGADNAIDLGSAALRWRDIWAGNSIKVRNNTLDTLSLNAGANFDITSDVDLTINGVNLTLNATGGGTPILAFNGGQIIATATADIQLTPGATFNVAVGLDGTALLPSLTFGTVADPNTGVFHPAIDTLALSTNGTERSRWSSNGDVVFAGGTGADRFFWDQTNLAIQVGGVTYGFAGASYTTTILPGVIWSFDPVGNLGRLDIVGAPLNLQTDGTTAVTVSTATLLATFSADLALQLEPGNGAAVAPAGTGRFRYNGVTNTLQISNNTGAYVDIATGSGMAIGGTVTGGTQGSVLFIGAASVLAQDNANFFWDDSNNRLGLLTTTPGNTLDIRADGTAAAPVIALGAAADPNTGIFHPAADEIAISAGGSERIRFRLSSAVNGTPRISIPIGTLTGDGEWGVYETSTFLNGNTNAAYMFRVDGTGAGSGTGMQNVALFNNAGGYTGTARNIGVWGRNVNAQAAPAVGDLNNINGALGVFGSSDGASAGYNFGVAGLATGTSGAAFPNALYVGVYARAKGSIVQGTSIGVFSRGGHSGSGTTRIGGYFSNDPDSTPTFINGALIADSAYASEPIFIGRNGGTTRFTIAETGVVSIGIDGSAATTALTFGATADPNTGIFHPAADTLALSTAGTEAMRIISTGEIGVGNAITPASGVLIQATRVANATTRIDVANTQVGTAAAGLLSATSNIGAVTLTAFSSGFTTSESAIASAGRLESSSGLSAGLVLSVGNNGAPLLFYSNTGGTRTEKARMFSVGNWSFGGTTDLGQVTVDNGATAESILVLRDNGTTVGEMFDGGNISFGTTANLGSLAVDNGAVAEDILILRDNGTTVVSVIDGGDTGIGVTPTEKLSLKDHSAFAGSETQLTTGAVQTTDATQTNAVIITLSDTSVYWFEAHVIGRRTDVVGDRVHYLYTGLCYREGGGAVIEAQTNIVTQESAGAAAFDSAFTASGNAIRVTVQGEAAKTVNWTTTLRYQRVSGSA